MWIDYSDMKFVNKKTRNSWSVKQEKDYIFVNKRLDCVETGIVCFAVYPGGRDACVSGDIHAQYTQTDSIRLRQFTIRLDSHGVDSHYRKSRSMK